MLWFSFMLFVCCLVPLTTCQSCNIDPYDRTDCRYGDQTTCVNNGCCWSPTWNGGPAWCFYPEGEIPTSGPTTNPPPGVCTPFSGDNSGNVICNGGEQTEVPAAEEKRRWQTPTRGAADYFDTYQDYSDLVGYAHVLYSSNRTVATIEARTFLKTNATLTYYFGSAPAQSSNVYIVNSNFRSEMVIKVTSDRGHSLVLEPVGFLWLHQVPVLAPGYENGQRGGIAELFGWPYADIEQECEFLGKAGYLGIKVFPQAEHVMSDIWFDDGELNPWYWIYQPVSYKLTSRAGTREELRKMIETCRSHGVRVYADAVVNHMSGGGNDVIEHCNGNVFWGAKDSSAGSPYFTHSFTYKNSPYTNQHPGCEFPGVPYGPLDFHCERSLASWSDPFALNYGWLVGLTDLNTERPYVQQRIASYFVDLLNIGFSGFRIDAAKHIQPDDLADILAIFRSMLGGTFPDDFFTWLEVIIGGEKDLLCCQYNDYNWYGYFTDALKARGFSDADILKVKIWSSDYPKEFPVCGSWILPSERFAIQNDDHDQQNDGSSSRDMGDKGSVLIKERNVDKHRQFETQLFTRTDGNWKVRMVLSSYTFMENGAAGYPDGWSDCSRIGNPAGCKTVPYSKAHDPLTCGYTVDGWVGGKYTRVHRDLSIVNAMRSWLGLSKVTAAELGLPSNCV